MNKKRDRPWMIRTYSGHSTAKASNDLYKKNLAKGQTGLSVAFDLPTQTGYDADDPMSHGEVGKVGVPVKHIDDMKTLFDGIDLATMNTSMTINATAAWLLALYIATAEDQGACQEQMQGTTQNDIIKEYLSRGTYIFPPEASLRLQTDMITYSVQNIPQWNPMNICSYHLQEAGATPAQEIAYAFCNAMAILDAVKASGTIPDDVFPKVVGRISFFVNAGIRFVEEMCKMRAFTEMWEALTRERYGVADPKYRRFRYGVQVNSLGLTERQPENNIMRIVYEMLGVTLSKNARARAIQLPAWNEALGIPRPWDQQLSLRSQQILACETDLLEYGDIFAGSSVIEEKVAELKSQAQAEIDKVLEMGGAVKGIEYMKTQLVRSHAARIRKIENGEISVVGVNCYETTEKSPLLDSSDEGFLKIDAQVEENEIGAIQAFRKKRESKKVEAALDRLKKAAECGDNIMPASIDAAHAGVTTGEWGAALRAVFGEYRAPTGVGQGSQADLSDGLTGLRDKVGLLAKNLGGPPRILLGKPGLDGHSNGAEQIALRARDAGYEVIYQGIRLSPEQIVSAALQEGVHVVGLSILSGSHVPLVMDIIAKMQAKNLHDVPLVLGGIIPPEDAVALKKAGVALIYTPKDFNLNQILSEITALLIEQRA
jgi:ethylmalonyl-CoA mutase